MKEKFSGKYVFKTEKIELAQDRLKHYRSTEKMIGIDMKKSIFLKLSYMESQNCRCEYM